ncbi:MAG: hypothetical protein R3D69_16405 [Xanthobacteraceae bacterium]
MQIAESLAGDEVHDGYTVIGAASSGAFRFKWMAREVEDGRFIVHETVGAGTVAVSSQPMPREEVVGYISERRQRIQRRIDDVKRDGGRRHRVAAGSAEAGRLAAAGRSSASG